MVGTQEEKTGRACWLRHVVPPFRTPREFREREKDGRAQSARVPTSGTKFSEGTLVLKQRKDTVMGMPASVLTFLVRQRHWEGTWL